MKSNGAITAEVQAMLTEMAAEAADLKRAVGGSITDALADWLAQHYALAARERLARAEGDGRLEILRAFAQDWAMLRHGDHTAERLHIERERLDLSKRDSQKKWQTKLDAGLDLIAEKLERNPKAMAAYEALREHVRADCRPQQEEEFRAWLKWPEIRKEFLPELTRGISPETWKKIEEELHLL